MTYVTMTNRLDVMSGNLKTCIHSAVSAYLLTLHNHGWKVVYRCNLSSVLPESDFHSYSSSLYLMQCAGAILYIAAQRFVFL